MLPAPLAIIGKTLDEPSGRRWRGLYLANTNDLFVGTNGNATLAITGGGLVSVGGALTIDEDQDGDRFLNMATGGMLALDGDVDGSIAEFLGIVEGTDAIRYWDYSTLDWADITSATYGVDYTLEYLTEGDLAGYTVLTVGEPGVPGDWDGDSDVDIADLMIIQRSGTDYDMEVWREQFGAAQAVAAVPEPGRFGWRLWDCS